MKKMYGFIGISLGVFLVSYVIWKKSKNEAKDHFDEDENFKKENDRDSIIDNSEVEREMVITKATSVDSIVLRHQEAAKVMKDAVDIICKRNEIDEDENKKMEQVSKELDELLEE